MFSWAMQPTQLWLPLKGLNFFLVYLLNTPASSSTEHLKSILEKARYKTLGPASQHFPANSDALFVL